MKKLIEICRPIVLTAGLAAFLVGCAVQARVYDPYYHDYHRWDNREAGYYSQWEVETHREHRDFDRRNDNDKKEYWDWRHKHGDNDHGHDHDHD